MSTAGVFSQTYRNLKNGEYYLFLGVATNCTNSCPDNDKIMVLYRKHNDPFEVFARERKEFLEKFEPVNSIVARKIK